MNKVTFTLSLLALALSGAQALASESEPVAAVKAFMTTNLEKGALPNAEKLPALCAISDAHLDLGQVVAGVLRADLYKNATDAQKIAFTKAIKSYVVSQAAGYISKVAAAGKSEDFKYTLASNNGKDAVAVEIPNTLGLGSFLLQVNKAEDGYRIDDVVVGNTSLIKTNRAQFASANNIDTLTQAINAKSKATLGLCE